MQLHWLEQTASDLPAHTDWLDRRAAAYLHGLRLAKRRADWLLGRWTAKRTVAAYLRLPTDPRTLAEIEIRPEQSGAPEVYLAESPAGVSISLSHSSGVAACVAAPPGVVLGCDLEIVEPRSDNFIQDYFTSEELAEVMQADASTRDWLVTLFWSAKESALKALRTGLRLDTRSLKVIPLPSIHGQDREACILAAGSSPIDTWHRLQVCCATGQAFQGWWQHAGSLVRTVVAMPPLAPPVRLSPVADFALAEAPAHLSRDTT